MTLVSHFSKPWAGRVDFEKLLCSIFDSDDLRRWFTLDPKLYDIRNQIPDTTTSLSKLVHETAAVLLRHGLLEDYLFERLIREFPGRKSDIHHVWAAWRGHAALSATTPPPVPRFVDEAILHLTEALSEAYSRRMAQALAMSDTSQVNLEILELRRQIRQGPQLKAGDFLHHGRFRLHDQIGHGGFANVWRAYDREIHDCVAVKVLHGHKSSDPTNLERFQRGARNIANLRHPNIIKIVRTAFEDGGFHAYVMEYVPGGTLLNMATREQPSEANLIELFAALCDALGHAHEHGFIHRDIKPSNILVDTSGHARLTDFDMMKSDDTTGGTRSGVGIGTVIYSAPETWNNAVVADERSDVYSLGMTLLACIMRKDVDQHILRDAKACLREVEASLRLKGILARTINQDPTARPSSAHELCRLLQDTSVATNTDDLERFNERSTIYLASDRWDRETFKLNDDNRHITLCRDDICLIPAGALVCGISRHASVGILGTNITDAGGPHEVPGRHELGPLPPGKVMVAPGGKIASDHVLFVVQDDSDAATGNGLTEQIQLIVRRTLQVADALQLRTIAYPLLLTGVVGLPRDMILRLLFETLYKAMGATEHVEEAFIAIYPYDRAIGRHLPTSPSATSEVQVKRKLPLAKPLASNANMSFSGTKVVGTGFLLSSEERAALIQRDPRNDARIFRYLGADDVSQDSDHRAKRFIINFGHMKLEEAEHWPDLLNIIRKHVKPERETSTNKHLRRYWWRLAPPMSPLYERLQDSRRCIVSPQTSARLYFATCPSAQIFANTLLVHATDSMAYFACVHSRIFAVWSRWHASTLNGTYRWGLEAFNTFPFPYKNPQDNNAGLARLGTRLEAERQAFTRTNPRSLNRTYSILQDPAVTDADVQSLRRIHLEIDEFVLTAYGWKDMQAPPYATPDTTNGQDAINSFEDEVLERLSAVNQQRWSQR